MSEIALGVVVFTRTEKLRGLLESVEQTPIENVYIADNGRQTPQKKELYREDFGFDTVVLDLEYDIGLGYSRNRIVDEADEEFLLIVDSDNKIPHNVALLAEQLRARPDIGGIAGTMIEPEIGRICQIAKDFYEIDGKLMRTVDHDEKEIEYIAGSPFTQFDFIPNITMYRRECLEDYSWDPDIPIRREHADFYVGHWRKTDWKFGVCPEVLFQHYPGGNTGYVSHRHDRERQKRAEKYFLDKWGYDDFQYERLYWYDTHHDPLGLLDRARRIQREDGSKALTKRGLKKAARIARRNVFE